MGISSSAHLVFGVPINSEDHPEFWEVADPRFPDEEPEIDAWFVRHNKSAQCKLSYLSYGDFAYGDPDREEAILMIYGEENSFFGDAWEPGPGLRFGLNPELSGPQGHRSPQEPSLKEVVKATNDLIAAGIKNVDFRDSAWYLVASYA